MIRLILILILSMVAPPAMAQQLEYDVCPEEIAAASASADYVPGVDAEGNAVAPADIKEPLEAVTYPLSIPIELDTIRVFNLNMADNIALDTNIAILDVYKDGRVEYNGQDLSGQVSVNFKCDKKVVEVEGVEPAFEDLLGELIEGEAQ